MHFNAWAGSEHINRYLQWAAEELEKGYGVKPLKGQLYDGKASRRTASSKSDDSPNHCHWKVAAMACPAAFKAFAIQARYRSIAKARQ